MESDTWAVTRRAGQLTSRVKCGVASDADAARHAAHGACRVVSGMFDMEHVRVPIGRSDVPPPLQHTLTTAHYPTAARVALSQRVMD